MQYNYSYSKIKNNEKQNAFLETETNKDPTTKIMSSLLAKIQTYSDTQITINSDEYKRLKQSNTFLEDIYKQKDINLRINAYLSLLSDHCIKSSPFLAPNNWNTDNFSFIKIDSGTLQIKVVASPDTVTIQAGTIANILTGKTVIANYENSIGCSLASNLQIYKLLSNSGGLQQDFFQTELPYTNACFYENAKQQDKKIMMNAVNVIEVLKNFMEQLKQIKNIKCNAIIYTSVFNGGIYMHGFIQQFTVKKDLETLEFTGEGKTRSKGRYFELLGPFTKIKPANRIGIGTDIKYSYWHSNSVLKPDDAVGKNIYTNINNNYLCNITTLVKSPGLKSTTPTFDIKNEFGSNGQFRFYRTVKTHTFDLEKYIDLEKQFGIVQGKLIRRERILAAIDYIFMLWLKNLKTTECTYHICHYNCHANNQQKQESESISYQIIYKYDAVSFENLVEDVDYTKTEQPISFEMSSKDQATNITFPKVKKGKDWLFSLQAFDKNNSTMSDEIQQKSTSIDTGKITIPANYTGVIYIKYSVIGGAKEHDIKYYKRKAKNSDAVVEVTGIFTPTNYKTSFNDQTQQISVKSDKSAPTTDGLTWTGQFTAQNPQIEFDDVKKMKIPAGFADVIKLHMVYDEAIFKIIFDGNGGQIPPSNEKTYTVPTNFNYNDAVNPSNEKPSDPVKEGYDFTGWKDKSAGGKNIPNKTIKITQNLTYYAQWQEKL